MPAYTFYETDNRVRRYAETLVRRGDTVDVVALRRDNHQKFEEINGVNVYKIQKRTRNEKSAIAYFFKIFLFLMNSTLIIARNHLREPYDLVHVHSLPDFEVFAALLPRFAGTKVILDIHDLVPEFYKSKFGKANGSLLYNGLVLLEKASIAFSNHVIISNHLWYKTLISRSVDSTKCTVLMNYPDNKIFYRRNRTLLNDKLILMYPGVLSWHQGLDIAIKAFDKIKDEVPNAEFHIYGSGPIERRVAELIEKLGIGERCILKGVVSIEKIAPIMGNAHIGIIAKRNDCFAGEAFSTKTLEFMSLGVPIIVSKTKIDQYYFNESIVKFFEPENEDNLADAMLLLLKNPEIRNRLAQNALKFVTRNSWAVKKQIYFDLINSLVLSKTDPTVKKNVRLH
jgi:glycosyltransferase involved in cell wall biosynthesis